MTAMDENRSKRILKNTIFLYLRMFIVLAVGLYTSRIILKTLGETDFGIYGLVGGIVTMFVFVNQALSSATQRFITFDLGLGDINKLRRTFSMSINVYAIFSIFLIILLESVGLFLLSKLNIDADRKSAANWVYQTMILSTVISMLRIPHEALIIANEKISFTATIGIIESFLKLGIVFLLVFFDVDKLKLYGVLYLCVGIISFVLIKIYTSKNFSFISKYQLEWDSKVFFSFLKFSGLSLYEQVAVMLTYQGIDVLLNLFFGVVVNAAMGITKQVQAAVFNFVSSFQGAMSPQITKSYATNDTQYLSKLMVVTPKFSLYLIILLSIPIFLNMENILNFWLDNPPAYAIGFCKLILISSVFESISLPLRTLIFAHGNIAKYQLIVGSVMLLNLVFSYVFLKLGYSPYSVLWIRIFIYFLVDFIRVLFIKNLINISLIKYIHLTFTPVLFVVVIGSVVAGFTHFYFNLPVLLDVFTSGLIVGLTILLLGLSSYEKTFIRSYIKSIIQ